MTIAGELDGRGVYVGPAPGNGETQGAVHIHELERSLVNSGVAPAARRMSVARILDRCGVSRGDSAGNGQTQAAVEVLDLNDVGAFHDGKRPET
jgi:hypothetical protein